MEKMMRKVKMKEFLKAYIWKFLLSLGTVPFLVPLFMGIHRAITGDPTGLIVSTGCIYGWEAFSAFVLMYSYLLWPTYLVGLALIILGIYKLKKG